MILEIAIAAGGLSVGRWFARHIPVRTHVPRALRLTEAMSAQPACGGGSARRGAWNVRQPGTVWPDQVERMERYRVAVADAFHARYEGRSIALPIPGSGIATDNI